MRPYLFRQKASPRYVERGAIITAVLAGHILLVILLCWQSAPNLANQLGANGQVVALSLVESSALLPAAQTTSELPKPAPKKPASVKPPPEKPADKTALSKTEALTSKPPEVSDTGLKPAATLAKAASPPDQLDTPDSPEVELSPSEMATLAAFSTTAAASSGTPDAPCHLTQTLALLFSQSPEIQLALADLPQEDRSVANAVMLWDGKWSAESRTGSRALLRALLIKAIADARGDCLNQVNRGPVLFFIPDTTATHATVIMAVGSGQWRWADVLAGNETLQRNLLSGDFFMPRLASNSPSAP